MSVGDLTYAFDPSKGETPESVARKRKIAEQLVGSIFGHAPQNVGEGLNAIGQALIARQMDQEANKAQAAGQSSAGAGMNDIIANMGGGGAFPIAPGSEAPSSTPDLSAAPITGPVFQPFIDTVKAGGVTNPYALAAVAATGRAESAFSPKNANRTWNDGENNAGGIMSLNGPRLAGLQNFVAANGGQGLGTPELQAQYFLKENPDLIASLNNAKSIDEALGLMNNAWRFKGYNDPNSPDAARRLAYAKGYLPQFSVPGVDAPAPAPAVDAVTALAGGQPPQAAVPAPAPMQPAAPVGDRDRLAPAQPPLAAANFDSRFGAMPAALPSPAAPPAFSLGPTMPFSAQPPQMEPPASPAQVAQNVNPKQMSDANALALLGARPVQPGQGASIADLLRTASNPWNNKNQSAILSALLQQKLKASDPSTQLDMRYKQAQIDHLTKAGGNVSYGQTPLMLTDPDNKMHMGQMSNGGGILIDGKVYNSLPDGWKVGTVSQSGAGDLSPEALDILATQYLAGDKSAIQGFSRSAAMRSQLANAIAAKANEMGMDGKAIAAEVSAYGGNVAAQRAAGTRAAQVGMAASEADKMADIAIEASTAVPRGSLVPWNALQNAVRTGTSSPEMAAFVTATTSLVNAYARAVSPLGAPTDAMRQHAEQMLNTAQSPEAYAAVINQMKKEMEAALNAPAEISGALKKQITGGAPADTHPQPANPPAAPKPSGSDLPPGVTEEDMQYTMKAHPEMTREQILQAIKGKL